jgi:hypothetical protein
MIFTTEGAEGAENEEEGLNRISRAVIGAAIEVHRQLGPGLLESAYEACLAFELTARGHAVERQKPLSVRTRVLPLIACVDSTNFHGATLRRGVRRFRSFRPLSVSSASSAPSVVKNSQQ